MLYACYAQYSELCYNECLKCEIIAVVAVMLIDHSCISCSCNVPKAEHMSLPLSDWSTAVDCSELMKNSEFSSC